MIWVSGLLASAVPVVLIGGYFNRAHGDGKGIGWQFIRFSVIALAIPVAGLLALNEALTGEAATLLGAAMSYAFAKKDG